MPDRPMENVRAAEEVVKISRELPSAPGRPFRLSHLAATLALGVLGAVSPTPLLAQDLPRITPEEVGWSSERLEEAAELAAELGYSALIMAQDGRVFFDWGRTRRNYKLHSIRKPLLGALYGIFVEEGVIDLDRTLRELGIDDRPPRLTDEEKGATVRHLLQSRSGVYHPAAAETQGMRDSRPRRGSHGPGEYFYYNNWDFNTLGTIFRNATGEDIFKAFQERVAEPIGMQDFDTGDCRYNYHRSSDHPQYSFRMSARDLLRFGILYEQRGIWNGARILPEDWIDGSTSSEHGPVDERTGSGFGYMWGLITEGSPLADIIGGAGFFLRGLGGHALTVVPKLGLVYVLRVDTDGPFTTPTGVGELFAKIRDARVGAGG